jgi:hypothetical protein
MYLQMHIFALTINVSSNFRPKGRKGFAKGLVKIKIK